MKSVHELYSTCTLNLQQHKQCAGQTVRVVSNVNQSGYSSH